MGNYKNLEIDFIQRTIELIYQYNSFKERFPKEKQYDHTLIVNCLLGLIVMPKEKVIRYLPKDKLDQNLKESMGITHTKLNPAIENVRDLIIALRHSSAHFDISFESHNEEEFLIDSIVFRDITKGEEYIIASFVKDELLNFLHYYGDWLINNLEKYK